MAQALNHIFFVLNLIRVWPGLYALILAKIH